MKRSIAVSNLADISRMHRSPADAPRHMKRIKDPSDLPDISRSHASAADALRLATGELRPAIYGTNQYWRKERGSVYWHLRRDLPYAIQNTDLPGVQILVNRQYKPLGSTVALRCTDENVWAIYEHYPHLHVRLTPAEIHRICLPWDGYLFNDGCPPWRGRKEATEHLTRLCWLEESVARGNGSLPEAA